MGSEKKYISYIKYSEEQIQEKLKIISKEITNYFGEEEELVIIPILKGGLNFAYDLMKHLQNDLSIDFIKSKSYTLKRKINKPNIIYNPSLSIENKHVILVDDIVDSGETINKINDFLYENSKPKSISVATVVLKPTSKIYENIKTFVAWNEDPGGFLMGYGLDYDEKYRNLPYIAIIKENIND